MEEFRAVAPLASDQPPYNLFERQIDARRVLPWCAANSVAVLTYSSLCRSLLAGRVMRGMTFDRKDIRSVDPKVPGAALLAVHRPPSSGSPPLRGALRQDGAGTGRALGAGPARHQRCAVGAQTPRQLDAVAGVLGWKLDAEAMAEIDRIVAESVTDPVGPEYLTPKVRED